MSEALKPCPFCGNPRPDFFEDENYVTCNNDECLGHMPFDQWQFRTPGPATKAMLVYARAALAMGELRTLAAQTAQDFLDEWPDQS